MRLSLKQMLWLWGAIIVMVGLLFGMAYKRFNSEVLVDGLRKELRKIYPHSKIQIGEVKTHFLIDINIGIDELIVEKDGIKELAVNHLELKVPWWALLIESGRVQLNIEGLLLNLPANKNPLLNKQVVQDSDSSNQPAVELSLPHYVLNSSLNIRIKDLEIIDPELGERRLKLSKVIIRDYKPGQKTAFELNIPLSIKWGGSYDGEIWVFGDFVSNHETIQTNWRADTRGFKQEEWNLNDIFFEGKGVWNHSAKTLESEISLIYSSKKISDLSIKVSKDNLVLSGPVTQLPLDIVKPLIKQFHPKSELSFFKGNELANGQFSWSYTWPGVKHHFDLKLAFEGEFYKDWGIWNLQWLSESYHLDFISSDKKTKFAGNWSPAGIHQTISLDGKNISGAYLTSFDPFITTVFNVPEQKLDLKYKDVFWKDKLYSGDIALIKKSAESSRSAIIKLIQDKTKLDSTWTKASDSSQKFSLDAKSFTLGPFGSFFHSSLSDSSAVVNGKFAAEWNTDVFQGKGSSNLIISNFSDGKASWMKYWDFVAKIFSLPKSVDEVNLQSEWKAGIYKVKKLTVVGPQVKGNFTGKLDFTGKKSELIYNDQNATPAKKTTNTFVINEFMRSL